MDRTKLTREEQRELLGILVDMRERINSANLRARMCFRRMDGSMEILNMSEWMESIRASLDKLDALLGHCERKSAVK